MMMRAFLMSPSRENEGTPHFLYSPRDWSGPQTKTESKPQHESFSQGYLAVKSQILQAHFLLPTSQHCYRKIVQLSKMSMAKRWRDYLP